MIKTRLASTVAAFMFGFAALFGTVLTLSAPASAASSLPTTNTPSADLAASNIGRPLNRDPYPETSPFSSLPDNPWS